MVEVACPKCGTKVPEGGKFCLSCGVPIGGKAANPPPAPAPVQPMRQMGGLLDTLFSKTFITLGALLGILLAWVGGIIFIFSTDLTGFRVAMVINSLGFAGMGIFLIGGGIANNKMDKFVRLGMILGGTFLIGVSLVVSLSSLLTALGQAAQFSF